MLKSFSQKALAAILLIPVPALADGLSVYQLVDAVQDMLMAVAILLGLSMVVWGLILIKKAATPEGRLMRLSFPKIALIICAGVGLLSLPTWISITTTSMVGYYPGLSNISISDSLRNITIPHVSQKLIPPSVILWIIGVVKLIGFMGLIRGFYILTEAADATKRAIFARFLCYIIGGAILFHCMIFWNIVESTWHLIKL